MTRYYDEHPFSKTQAEHALAVVLNLMKNRRFFLQSDLGRFGSKDPDLCLNPDVFLPAIVLNKEILAAYESARETAKSTISRAERCLGVVEPDLSNNKQVVQCSRYTGGFGIAKVYPFTAFGALAPKSFEDLVEERFRQLMGGRTDDEVAPKELREYREYAESHSQIIWNQFESLDVHNSNNDRCLIVMPSRCPLGSSDENGDFAEGRVWDIQEHPHAVGYLFHAYSMKRRIVEHSHVVMSTSRASHVNVQHWNKDEPSISYDKTHGYDCSVFFVTVL